MSKRSQIRIFWNEFRAWGGLILAALSVVVFLSSLGSAQAAPLPRAFLEIFAESRSGIELLERIGAPARGTSAASQISHALEFDPAYRSVRALLSARAQQYGEALYVESEMLRGGGPTQEAFERLLREPVPSAVAALSEEARVSLALRTYQDISRQNREWVLEMMNNSMRNYGLDDLVEFMPRAGATDFVGILN